MKISGLLAVLLILLLVACGPEKAAQKAFKAGKYQQAIDKYLDIVAKQPGNGKANYFIAESYRLSNRINMAEMFYSRAKGPGVDADSVKFHLAQAMKANGKYAEARQVLSEVRNEADNDKLKRRAESALAGIDALDKLSQKKNYYKVRSLETLNTPFAEYAPAYLNNELYFTSSRTNNKIYLATGTPFTDLYKASTKGANVDVSTIAPLPSPINSDEVNEGCITFSPDGRTMVFAKGNNGKRKGAKDVDLYICRFRNGKWTDPVPANGINTPDNWESTPAFSQDGRTMYFSSNRKGGQGGLDLYSAQMDSRGRFGKVRNLGPEINTGGDEMFPYVAENGKLYFSSDGHPGYGMLDLFVVNRVNGRTVVENLGQPVNSPSDDFGIFLFKPDRGFFTSNREGGKGDDDIYTFINEDPNLKVVNYYLEGVTYTQKGDSAREILPNTKVTMLDARGDAMQDFTTGNDGKFLFRVYENENYTLIGEAEGYLVERQSYTTIGKSVPLESLKELVTNITLDTVVVLDKKLSKNVVFELKNIYFGYDSADIRSTSARELDKLVQILNDNPEIKIELGSHTDSVGTVEKNINLSQRRASATVNYLIKKGIAAERLVAKGYGKSKPIARNTNPDGTDNPEGRQRNRRTEFRILEIGPMQKKAEDEFDEDKYFKNDNKN